MGDRRNLRSRKRRGGGRFKLAAAAILVAGAAALCFIAAGSFVGGAGAEYSLAAQISEENQKTESRTSQQPAAVETSAPVKEPDPTEAPDPKEALRQQAEAIAASMTLEEKVCQLFMVTPEQLTGVGQVTAAGDATRQALLNRPVGGLIYFRQNLRSPEQTRQLLENTREIASQVEKLPLLLAVDEEGGSVTRIGGQSAFGEAVFPDMAQIGAEGNPQKAYEVGKTIGAYLKKYGFNMDFAPDADVLTNSDNRVVADRSFGRDPQLVWDMASQVAQGLMEEGIQPVYKHFPGHGATAGDTHEGFAYSERTIDQLRESELVPFQKAIDAGADCIMVGHISAPIVAGDDTPASLSEKLIQQLLRDEMGFEGVVVTDALNMGAIQEHYSSGDAAVKAIQAGADLLLMPADFEAARQGVLQAVEDGVISRERLDQSVIRIGMMKLKEQS